MTELLIHSIIIGILATFLMDIFAYLREKISKVKPLNYAFVARWILGWFDGQYWHKNIAQSPSKSGEIIIGWFFHYLIGIIWVSLFLFLNTLGLYSIHLFSSIAYGLITVFVPFLIMQPAFGFGYFAQRTPHPKQAMKNSLISHSVFGIAIYLSYLFFSHLLTL